LENNSNTFDDLINKYFQYVQETIIVHYHVDSVKENNAKGNGNKEDTI